MAHKVETRIFLLLTFTVIVTAKFSAQALNTQKLNGTQPVSSIINFAENTEPDWEVNVQNIVAQPMPASDYRLNKSIVNERRQNANNLNTSNSGRDASAIAPIMLNNFGANLAQGTPNDNHIAVSNNNFILSVVNTNVRIYNDTGQQLYQRSLSSFAATLGSFTQVSDPRVLYDPVEDRFILMFFSGSTSINSRIIIAFTQSNNPLGNWNFYSLSGNYLNDTTWSDYPIVSLSRNDLFITFNHLKDNEGWQTGFRYSAIWQINKHNGYAGIPLNFTFWNNIVFDNKPIWSICPVQGSFSSNDSTTYFLSVRPADLENDTVFIHSITGTQGNANAQLYTRVFTTPTKYGLPPNAKQKDGQWLATNDARVLSACIENNRIHYVQNTVAFNTVRSSVYYGQIEQPQSTTPTFSAQVITDPQMEFGYPSITSISNGPFDNRCLITCSFTSLDTFPGTAVFYRDADGNISEPLIVKRGERAVNVLLDTTERWGDYSGIQRKYNEPNTAWIAGSYAAFSAAYRTWIAKVANTDSASVSGLVQPTQQMSVQLYPNPTSEKITLSFDAPENNFMLFELCSVKGEVIRTLLNDHVKPGQNTLSFNASVLARGIYYVHIYNNGKLTASKPVVKQ